jgi:cell division septation protein DedD
VAPVLPATVEETVAPVQVAVPLPATVDEPETVAVPMPATAKVPSSVPAGDGSTAPQVPRAAFALLLASLVGLGAAATALVIRRQE